MIYLKFNSKLIVILSVYFLIGIWISYTFLKPEKTDEIVFSVGAGTKEISFIKEIITEYEKENPGIKVKLNTLPSPTDQQHHYYLSTLGARTKNVDIMRIDTIWIPEFASANWLEPLDSLLSAEERNSFIPITEKTNVFNRNLYAIPWNINVGLLYYRKDFLEKYHFSLPVTWKQFVTVCEKISEMENVYGYLWQGKQYEGLVCNFIEFIGSNNGQIIDDDGNVVINSAKNKTALSLMHDLIWKYKISPQNTYSELMEESSRHLFQQGKGLFLRNWTYVWDLCQEDMLLKNKVGVSLLPKFENGSFASVCGGWHLAMNANSEKKKQAWKLIEFLTSAEVQKKLAMNLSWAPTRSLLYNDAELIEKLPFLLMVEQSIKNIQVRPNVPYYQWISDVLQKYINKVLSHQMEIREALKIMQDKIERIKNDFAKG
ncbi:MAG: ABC transporter substrate-binding protein [Candidatus Kuenenia sp.]|nr:ABC transporter substrate-binding protein [Candidatus Kuenenia hertensis]